MALLGPRKISEFSLQSGPKRTLIRSLSQTLTREMTEGERRIPATFTTDFGARVIGSVFQIFAAQSAPRLPALLRAVIAPNLFVLGFGIRTPSAASSFRRSSGETRLLSASSLAVAFAQRASHHPAEFRPGKRCVAASADDRIHAASAPCAALIVGLTRVHAQTRAANQMQILTPKPASHRTMLPVKTGPRRTRYPKAYVITGTALKTMIAHLL
jgi:hypothetical protein